jgi:hypothetical protein
MQPGQPEQPRGLIGQAQVGPREHRTHVGSTVAGNQRVQPLPGNSQLSGQLGERGPGPHDGAGGQHHQSDRKTAAVRD